MKLSLIVQAQGKGEGKVIPVTLSQFLIGRDPECQLRPASPVISKRHCAVLVRNGKAFVRDFDSTNGTFINDAPVKGEMELHHDDRLKVGPLLFGVRIEEAAPASKPAAPAAAKAPAAAAKASVPAAAAKAPVAAKPAPVVVKAPAATAEDDDAAALLLAMGDDDTSTSGTAVDSDGVPTGSTIMDMVAPSATDKAGQDPKAKTAEKKDAPKPAGNTSVAAKAILEKYMRRPRG
jgi:pSer/pThr/pTyr-binding forkhead associated (FHA) protein